jgi:hypothetical protein
MKALRILLAVAVAVMMMAPAAFAEFSIGGNVEINTDFSTSSEEKAAADGSDVEMTSFSQGGRVEAAITGKTEMDSGMYAAGKGVFSIGDDGGFGSGDMYFELGSAGWYMRAGRPEAEGLFGKGADIYIVGAPGAPGRYEANYSRGRDNIGAIMAFMPSDALKVEVDVMYGSSGGNNIMGARPLVVFGSGGLTVKAGVDYYMETPQDNDAKGETTKLGFGGNAEFGMGAITLGASAAMGTVGGKDATDADLDDEQTLSVFGYAKMGVGAGTMGVGGGMTTLSYDKAKDEKDMIEFYVSFDTPLPVDGAAIKFGASYATATMKPDGGDETSNNAFGGRVRLWYDFGSI